MQSWCWGHLLCLSALHLALYTLPGPMDPPSRRKEPRVCQGDRKELGGGDSCWGIPRATQGEAPG